MKWISVKEQLPKEGERVLAFGKDIGSNRWDYEQNPKEYKDKSFLSIQLCTYQKESDGFLWIYNHHCCEEELVEVTHWMSLPKNPEYFRIKELAKAAAKLVEVDVPKVFKEMTARIEKEKDEKNG
jgi:hypothetical protein